ncbi:MAG: MotA/TolQ/ExbB proton channel family protein [Gammaproteobacteria bacterium]|nr:MotA/TolQ/ExbB proton channel family protein [Gammaproteobacteria bacterium]
MKQSDIDNIFIYWVYYISLIIIALFILGSIGFISNIFRADISYISSLIFIIFNFYIFQCGYYLYKLRDAIFYIDTVEVYKLHNMFIDICSEYRLQIESNTQNQISSQDELKSKLYEFVDNGFFISDLLLKLGIIGTVVGFIIMLSSLSAIDEMNLSKMNNLLLSMSAGMKVALYTTLTGLIGSILLTIQYNFFESKINIFINKVLNSKKHEKKE